MTLPTTSQNPENQQALVARTAAGSEGVVSAPVNVRSTSLIVLMIIGVTASLFLARAFFAPLVLGLLISYALYPIVSFLDHRLRVPRPLGAGIVVLMLVSACGYGMIALQGQLVVLLAKVPAALEELRSPDPQAPEDDRSVLERLSGAANQIDQMADRAAASFGPSGTSPSSGAARAQAEAGAGLQTPAGNLAGSSAPTEPVRVTIDDGAGQYMGYVVDGSFGFLLLFGQAVAVLLLVYFALASGDLYKHKLVRISGNSLTEKKITVQILEQINRQLRLFLFVTLIGAIFVGVATGLAFWWLSMQQAMLWGVIAGTASVVPYVGPAFVFATSGLAALLQFGSLGQGLFIAAVSLLITGIQGSLLTPWLTSKAASMNAVAIFISLLFWGWLWGPVGLIVATPILMVIKSVCDHVVNLQGVGEVISDARPRPKEPETPDR